MSGFHYPRPQARQLCDSDRNILASLAHEADEPCVRCGTMLTPHPMTGRFDFSLDQDNEEPVCEECYVDAYEEWAEAQAERRADR